MGLDALYLIYDMMTRSDVDVNRRTAMARRTFNELYWMWNESQLPLQLKLRIFDSNILTRVVSGSEMHSAAVESYLLICNTIE